jgi:hypothetical protein
VGGACFRCVDDVEHDLDAVGVGGRVDWHDAVSFDWHDAIEFGSRVWHDAISFDWHDTIQFGSRVDWHDAISAGVQSGHRG